MKELFLLIQILTAVLAFANGIVCFCKPSRAIEIQKKFYEKINWRIEPIDMAKELRNTKIMGQASMFLAILIIIVTITSKW